MKGGGDGVVFARTKGFGVVVRVGLVPDLSLRSYAVCSWLIEKVMVYIVLKCVITKECVVCGSQSWMSLKDSI